MSIRNLAHPDRPAKPDWKDPESVKAYARAYAKFRRLFEADKVNAMGRQWHRDNPEISKARVKRWKNTHRDANRRIKLAHYHKVTRERGVQYQNRRKTQRKAERKWAAAHLDVIQDCVSRRRALQQGAAVGTDRQAYRAFVKIVRTAKSIPCYWCGKKTKRGDRHIDHVVPLGRKGKDDVYNLCCSCVTCNLRKSIKMPEEFTGQYVLLFA